MASQFWALMRPIESYFLVKVTVSIKCFPIVMMYPIWPSHHFFSVVPIFKVTRLPQAIHKEFTGGIECSRAYRKFTFLLAVNLVFECCGWIFVFNNPKIWFITTSLQCNTHYVLMFFFFHVV